MAIVPRQLGAKVMFFQTRLDAFAANAAAIGLTTEEVAHLQTLVDDANAARLVQGEAMEAARAATARYNAAVDAVATAGGTAMMKVRAQARLTDSPEVLSLALLPPIADPSPVAAPGAPTQLSTAIDGNGSIILSWKCKNPKGSTGTLYQLSRSIAGGAFEALATVGEKTFTDTTIPAGATALEYAIRAVRSTKAGPRVRFPVSFGSNGLTMPVSILPTSRKTMIAA